jgi:arsenate reductase
MSVTIYHNPRCSTSRTALALIRDAGIEPVVVNYLITPPSRERLRELLREAGLAPREAMRRKEALYAELGLEDERDDERLLDAMLAHPVLIERPFVQSPLGVRLGRPSSTPCCWPGSSSPSRSRSTSSSRR